MYRENIVKQQLVKILSMSYKTCFHQSKENILSIDIAQGE